MVTKKILKLLSLSCAKGIKSWRPLSSSNDGNTNFKNLFMQLAYVLLWSPYAVCCHLLYVINVQLYMIWYQCHYGISFLLFQFERECLNYYWKWCYTRVIYSAVSSADVTPLNKIFTEWLHTHVTRPIYSSVKNSPKDRVTSLMNDLLCKSFRRSKNTIDHYYKTKLNKWRTVYTHHTVHRASTFIIVQKHSLGWSHTRATQIQRLTKSASKESVHGDW